VNDRPFESAIMTKALQNGRGPNGKGNSAVGWGCWWCGFQKQHNNLADQKRQQKPQGAGQLLYHARGGLTRRVFEQEKDLGVGGGRKHPNPPLEASPALILKN